MGVSYLLCACATALKHVLCKPDARKHATRLRSDFVTRGQWVNAAQRRTLIHTHLGEDGLLRELIQLHLRDRGAGAGVGALQAAAAAGPEVDRVRY